jgi:hypothetical protein
MAIEPQTMLCRSENTIRGGQSAYSWQCPVPVFGLPLGLSAILRQPGSACLLPFLHLLLVISFVISGISALPCILEDAGIVLRQSQFRDSYFLQLGDLWAKSYSIAGWQD